VLVKARLLGLSKVLVTCDDSNLTSARVIEKAGGVLEDVRRRGGPI
jgi:predicted acetyltransferase